MNAVFTAREIIEATHGKVVRGVPEEKPGGLAWRLEDISEGDWFVALSSGADDSHDTLSYALELGAQGCIVNRQARYSFAPENCTLIAVTETWIALSELAHHWRNVAAERVLTVTGTEGRRDTVSFLEFLLRRNYRCHVAQERGDLKCLEDLLAMPKGTELLIAEVSGIERGDVARAGSYLEPDLAVITKTHHPIPSKARDARAAAINCEILETVKDQGTAVVYDRSQAMQDRCEQLVDGINAIRFSEDSRSISKSVITWLSENSCIAQIDAHTEANAWCALTAAVCLGFSLEENPHIVSEVVVGAS